ncbi:hypothetical protein [Archangium lansingense]|uniref:Uncharacterized protein n=1 Tax=Archangium lansingense TaxID=2995310 RepID=A0ABT4ALX0_9BACT|nr:hypothetical protein [Archangium lansinium]MCY1082694.1 hypothetical protein [Archangium lansinium]
MRWHALLAALSGILLMLPLVWLLHAAMFEQGMNPPHAKGKTPVPMLSNEQRRELLTYGQSCVSDKDCEAPLRCFFSSHTMSRYCTDSRCVTDLQCREGFVCRTQSTSDGTPLRVCSLAGERKEGEVCIEHSPSNDYACEKDLLCQSRCGRPCQPEEPSSCPEGFFCQEGPLDGPSCLPTCEGRTCPDGQRCIALDKPVLEGRHASICATVYGQDCQQSPCPQDQFCLLQTSPQPADAVWMQCTSACGQGAPACPEGTVCHQYRCHPSCAPEDASSCEPGFTCHRKTEQEPWRCVPTPRASRNSAP